MYRSPSAASMLVRVELSSDSVIPLAPACAKDTQTGRHGPSPTFTSIGYAVHQAHAHPGAHVSADSRPVSRALGLDGVLFQYRVGRGFGIFRPRIYTHTGATSRKIAVSTVLTRKHWGQGKIIVPFERRRARF